MCATILVEVSYSNEIIKKYETKFVKYLHITQCIFVRISKRKEVLQKLLRKTIFFRMLTNLIFKQRH